MRALEVIGSTGISVTAFRKNIKKERPFKVIKLGINLSKERLYANISSRVDEMITQGLVTEVEQLHPYRNLNALQTVGYKELFDYIDGRCSLQESIQKIKANTKQYAKRQLTWFKKDKAIFWLNGKQ